MLPKQLRHLGKIAVICPLAVSILLVNTGCDSVAGANIIANALPRFTVTGPGFQRTLGVPAEAFMSKKLRFQEAVIKNDLAAAQRNIEPRYVNDRLNGQPSIFYAALNGNGAMLDLLIRHGADVHYHSSGHSLAYWSASLGHSNAADQLVQRGGGTRSDVSAGRAEYAANRERQRRQAQATAAAALLILGAMISSSSHSSSGDEKIGGTNCTATQLDALDRDASARSPNPWR